GAQRQSARIVLPPPVLHHRRRSDRCAGAEQRPLPARFGLLLRRGGPVLYPHSVPSAAASPPLGPAKRKRGRPRKYGTPEQALAAKKAAGSSSSYKERKERQGLVGSSPSPSPYSGSSKKSQLLGLGGNAGQGFIPHVITVAAGEDVAQKIMLFMQQSKREICILSASGSISNASLRQPATSGGNITYEGRFEIITLSGSYVLTELGGRTGGLSVCLSSTDGQIIGGGVGGPLLAAGPVQVIIGSFLVDAKNNTMKGNASGKLPSPLRGPSPLSGFRSGVESSVASHFMVQPGANM
ncbi:AT-hook motif nuclear-localized protein, partial [Psidium guajava]